MVEKKQKAAPKKTAAKPKPANLPPKGSAEYKAMLLRNSGIFYCR